MPKTKLTKNQEKYIVKKYDNGNGKFANELAREFGIYKQVVTNCLKRNGVTIIQRYNPCNGEKNGNWNDGIRNSGGYKFIFNPNHHLSRKDGWVLVHRINMENKLGRKLKKCEVVHHKDGDRNNNEEYNLEVFKNNGSHIKDHCKKFKRNSKGQYK